ncbi:MAG: DUF4129 domain-containing protein [Thermomicrobiales bacterium]|nr:DUF4129 domain-containing protein [Thermomicrobiales bacterium]
MSLRVLRFTTTDWVHAALLLMAESAIAWLAINLLVQPVDGSGAAMSASTVAMLMVAALAVPRLCHDWGIWGSRFSVVLVAAVLLTTAIAVQRTSFPAFALFDPAWIDEALAAVIREPSAEEVPIWVVLISSAIVWWRGVMRGRPDIDTGLALLRVGSVILVVLVVAHTAFEQGFDDRRLSAAVLVFYSATLLAIAMLRQEMVPWRAPKRWLETVLLPVVMIVLPASILIGLLTRDLNGMVDLLLDPVILVLTVVFRIVSFVLVLLAMIILVPIVWLISKLPIAQPGEDNQSPVQIAQGTVTQVSETGSQLPNTFKYLVATLLIMAIFAGIVRFRLRLGFVPLESDDDRRSARVEGSLLDGLKDWLDGRRSRQPSGDADSLAALRNDPRWRHTVRIRDRYADFLRWSSGEGLPRTISTTPDELHERWEGERSGRQSAAIATLTDLYDRARYGDVPMTEADALAMEEAWRVLRDGAALT